MELFVSDLDGTLLNKASEVSENSRTIINELIEKGVKFTVATARTHATVIELLEGNLCGMKNTSCADQLAKALKERL